MIIHTLSSDASIALELGRRIAKTDSRRSRRPRRSLGVMWSGLFVARPPVKLARTRA